ncbi:MAG: tetratricopeptide repeat protein [Flavobacterium sp.]|nr:MAG: tetratricopeptide repeat protein [Flavobacterium sp.]
MFRNILFACILIYSSKVTAQNNQLQLARNAVGKLQASVMNKEGISRQTIVIKDGLKAVEIAKNNKKTRKYGETWAIRAYLNSYYALITENSDESERYFSLAKVSLDTARALDKEQVNSILIDATFQNINIRKKQNGNKAFYEKDFFEAFRILREQSDFYETDTSLALNTGIAALYIQRNEDAFFYLKRASENDIKDPAVYQNLSRLYYAKQETDAAIKTLETAVERNPGNPALRNDYINILLDNQRYDKALNAIETTLKNSRENHRLFYLYGFLNQNVNNISTAELAFKKAIDLNVNYFDAYYQLGLLYLSKANKVIKKPGNEYANAIVQAEDTLLRAYNIKPNDKDLIKLLIEVYKNTGKQDRVTELQRRLEEL